jgi:hypothetical protein
MSVAGSSGDSRRRGEPSAPPAAPAPERAPAWELVDAGRYRPRRIRGSFPGRELG